MKCAFSACPLHLEYSFPNGSPLKRSHSRHQSPHEWRKHAKNAHFLQPQGICSLGCPWVNDIPLGWAPRRQMPHKWKKHAFSPLPHPLHSQSCLHLEWSSIWKAIKDTKARQQLPPPPRLFPLLTKPERNRETTTALLFFPPWVP